ncbi:hypothetical protein CSQ88_01835 [Iodobacter sp. BJB302]|nr:hypothetical protein CSQ88_01835 [Iodobacter sp. BJB302]
MVSAPLQQAIQPRFIILIEKKSKDEFKKFYILMSQLSAILMCAIAGTIAIFSETLIFAWTGNSNTAQNVAPILLWYALSSGVMGMAALPFLFQFALGNLSLHIKGNILLTIVWLPLLYFVAPTYGAVGTGLAWLICNLVFMFVWIPFVHKKYATSLVWSWPLNILKIWAAGAITLYGLSSINLISDNRYVLFSWLVFVSMATTFACILVTPKISWKIVNLLRNKYGR